MCVCVTKRLCSRCNVYLCLILSVWECGALAPHILNQYSGCRSTSRPSPLPCQRKPSIYIHWETGLTPEPVWQFGKEKHILPPSGIEPRFFGSPVRCYSLYFLRYPGWMWALEKQTWNSTRNCLNATWILEDMLEVRPADQYGGMFAWFSA